MNERDFLSLFYRANFNLLHNSRNLQRILKRGTGRLGATAWAQDDTKCFSAQLP